MSDLLLLQRWNQLSPGTLHSVTTTGASPPLHPHVVQLPNATSYESNREELLDALALNLSIFIMGIGLWCCWFSPQGTAAHLRPLQALNRSASRLSGADDGAGAEGSAGDADAIAPTRNYLSFLLVCAYAFLALSAVNCIFLLHHGLVSEVLFGGSSILMVIGNVSYGELFAIISVDGSILLASSHLLHRLICLNLGRRAQGKLKRTVWLQGLPTHDSLRWWRPFQLNDNEVNRVKRDLLDALTDHLMVDQDSRHWPSLSTPHQGAPADPHAAEPSQDGRLMDSQVIEEIQVAVVLDEWYSAHTSLLYTKEYLDAYSAKQGQTLNMLYDPGSSCLRRLMVRPFVYFYDKRVRRLRCVRERLEEELADIVARKKRMSGSAFVTFRSEKHRDHLLKQEKISCWTSDSYSYFSFGRPPFASVTLTCHSAPHPSDVDWLNLHTVWWQRPVIFWSLAVVLFSIMVVVVTVVRISEIVVPLLTLLRDEFEELKTMDVLRHSYFPFHIKMIRDTLNTDKFWRTLFQQASTMVLLFINYVLLPFIISAISVCERNIKHSDAEMRRMFLNFFFLFLNTVVVPFFGVASVHELVSMVLQILYEKSNPIDSLQVLIFSSPGFFVLKYLINATFLSTTQQLLQIPQRFYRWSLLKFLALTDSDIKAIEQPWSFSWGYWYAWSLSIYALGINMSFACPGTLLVAALFFVMKYTVDKYNFDNGTFTLDQDIEGSLGIRVVWYLRVIIGFWWFTMGCCSYLTMIHQQGDLTGDETVWLERGGVSLMIAGTVTIAFSWWQRVLSLEQLWHDGFDCEKAPTWWDELARLLWLTQWEQQAFPVGAECATPKKRSDASMHWDGPQQMGLLPAWRG